MVCLQRTRTMLRFFPWQNGAMLRRTNARGDIRCSGLRLGGVGASQYQEICTSTGGPGMGSHWQHEDYHTRIRPLTAVQARLRLWLLFCLAGGHDRPRRRSPSRRWETAGAGLPNSGYPLPATGAGVMPARPWPPRPKLHLAGGPRSMIARFVQPISEKHGALLVFSRASTRTVLNRLGTPIT